MITITFRCSHRAEVDPDRVKSPVCPTCGETVVTHLQAPPPRFIGTVRGPHATYKEMEPATVDLAPGGVLKVRIEKEED